MKSFLFILLLLLTSSKHLHTLSAGDILAGAGTLLAGGLLAKIAKDRSDGGPPSGNPQMGNSQMNPQMNSQMNNQQMGNQ